MSDMIVVSFTGHRPNDLYGYGSRAPWTALCDKVAGKLLDLAKASGAQTLRVITGGAQGVDQVAFWAAEKVRRAADAPQVENHLYLPFPGQETRWKETGLFSQEEYRLMVDRADHVRYVTDHKPEYRSEVVAALMRRNEAMVDDGDLLVAVTHIDVRKIPTRGGTAAAMRYARQRGKRIVCLAP